MKTLGAAVVAAVLCVTLAACSGADSSSKKAATSSSLAPYTPGAAVQSGAEASQSSAAAAASAAAASSSAAAAPKPPGTTVDTAYSTVTYYAMQRPAARSAPKPESPGTEWVAIDVQVCLKNNVPEGAYISNQAWRLIDANNGNYGPSSTGYSQFPSPQFPFGDQPAGPGTCVRGWIVYPVVIGAQVVQVVYAPGSSTTGPVARWTP